MDIEKELSNKVQEYFLKASQIGGGALTLEGFLLLLLREEDDLFKEALVGTQNNPETLKAILAQQLQGQANTAKDSKNGANLEEGQISVDSTFREVFRSATNIAKRASLEKITLDVVIEAAFTFANAATQAFKNHNQIINNIHNLRSKYMKHGEMQEENINALEKYAINITQKAKDGKIDPIIGREEEIRRTMQILSRRNKNNPMLIGEPGVGKTAIVEGLAQRIVAGEVADSLLKKQIYALDMGLVMAGAKYRGELEDRLKAIIKAVTESHGEIILFIDEVHTLMGVGGDQGSISAANLLKPALARGELWCIGATTLKEYREYLEKDAALTRRFQPILVNEPTQEEAIAMLRGVKEKIELHHGIKIQDSSLVLAVKLAVRYIHERFLPDKALDVIEEAASKLKLELTSRPEAIDRLERQLSLLKMEQQALKQDITLASEQKHKTEHKEQSLAEVSHKVKEITRELQSLIAAWQDEKNVLTKINDVRQNIDNTRFKASNLIKEGNFEEAAKCHYEVIPSLEKELEVLEAKKESANSTILKNIVTEEQVYASVARITGIPLEKITQTERDKLLHLEDYLGGRIIGQDKAVKAVSNAIRRSKAGIAPANKPLGVFLFLGATGVGKTELTKALADVMFNSKDSMLRIDMSEYMEKHAISKLIGAPPGYIGYEEGGTLTESVRRNPWQIVLFDEVEKAHPEVFNLMLQIFDAGRLSDRRGRVIDFSNTIIIMTSNLGSKTLENVSGEPSAKVEKEVINNLANFFSPEFINRIDDIIVFNKLDSKAMEQIVELQLTSLHNQLKERNITIEFKKPEVVKYLVKKGFDPIYGARPLKRLIQKEIYDLLAIKLIANDIKEGSKVIVVAEKDGLVLDTKTNQ